MRKSPVEIVATAGTRAAGVSGLRGAGRFGRWADGVNAMREDCTAFAMYWHGHNEQVADLTGPLWVVLGDSTAQGLGAASPRGGYVGQVLADLRIRTGDPWQVLNLSKSGSLLNDVIKTQLPRVPSDAVMVTCGVGMNDILYTPPSKLFADLRDLIARVPDGTILLDLPLPLGVWGVFGRVSVPYVTRINRVLYEAAADRGLPVARVSDQFTSPWRGKFARDNFHPSQTGYRDWSRALLSAIA
jgi:acyl-CoA thioesterase I